MAVDILHVRKLAFIKNVSHGVYKFGSKLVNSRGNEVNDNKNKQILCSLCRCSWRYNQLQNELLTIFDLIAHWIIICKLTVIGHKTNFFAALHIEMERREKIIFENEVFSLCVFVNPRYKTVLSEDQRAKAMSHLTKTWLNKWNLLTKQVALNQRIPWKISNYNAAYHNPLLRTNRQLQTQNQYSNFYWSQTNKWAP